MDGSEKIVYKVVRSRRNTFAVQVTDDGSVIVKAPLLSLDSQARRIVENKSNWIRRTRARILRNRSIAEKMGGKLSAEELGKLKSGARMLISERVEHYSRIIGVRYGKVTIRAQKSRWGSCSRLGNLNFNCLLMLAPPEVLDSVVVHELCHIKQMNHSPRFYDEVHKAFPEYDKWYTWLKNNGPVLMARLP